MNRLAVVSISTLLTCVSINAYSADTVSEDMMEMVRRMCLAGDGYKMEFLADGSVSLKDINAGVKVIYNKENLDGSFNVPDEDKLQAFSKAMECIQPHIERILNAKEKEAEKKL